MKWVFLAVLLSSFEAYSQTVNHGNWRVFSGGVSAQAVLTSEDGNNYLEYYCSAISDGCLLMLRGGNVFCDAESREDVHALNVYDRKSVVYSYLCITKDINTGLMYRETEIIKDVILNNSKLKVEDPVFGTPIRFDLDGAFGAFIEAEFVLAP